MKKAELELIIETIPDAVAVFDSSGNIVYVNRAAEKILGLSHNEIRVRAYNAPNWKITTLEGKLFPEEEFPFVRVMKSGKPVYGVEYTIEYPDGKRIILSVNAAPVLDEKGNVESVAASFTDVTENKRLEHIMKARLRLLEFSVSHSMDEFLTATLDEIEALTGSNIGFYHFLEADQNTLLLQSWSTNTLKTMCTAAGKGSHYDVAQAGVWVDCVHEGRPVIHNDYASLSHRKGMPEGHAPVVREVVVPIFRGDLIKAIIGVGNKHTDYNETDIDTLFQLGDLSWDITERKRVEEALRQSEEKYRTIFQNSPLGIFRSTFEGRFLEVNPALAKIFGYDSPEAVIREIYNIAEQIYVRAEERREIVAEQLGLADITRHANSYRRKDGSQFIANLYMKTIRDAEGQPIFLEGIIEDITERKEKERFSNALNNINAIISSTLDIDEIMQRVIDKAAVVMGTETGAIVFREGGHWLTKYSYGYEENIIGVILTDETAPHAALAASIKKPVVINDAYNDPGVNLEIMKRYNIRSVITVPLIARDTTIGVLFLNYHIAPFVFTEAQIDFAGKLSAAVSLAIENARLYEVEHKIADTLQEALLTIPEHIKGMEYGYLYRSATEAAKVGGDFFDVFELEHDRVGIIVGDVSGKGLRAASLTSLVKNVVRVYAYEEASPAIVMTRTNNTVSKSIPESSFVTLFFGVIDMKSKVLTYCSAGHLPALLKKGSSVELLSEHSPILGAFPGLNYTQGDAMIEEGDMLVLYTDGITEARSDGEFFGEERLVNFVKSQSPISAKDFPQDIFNEVMHFTSGKLSDDVVLLALTLM